MTDMIRMRFQSARRPQEDGTLVLGTDGTFRIEPSEAMLEEIARLEQEAVARASRNSAAAAATLIGLGIIAAAAGWYAGRVGGRLRDRLTTPRSVRDLDAKYALEKGFQLTLHDSKMRSTSLYWEPGEYNGEDAERFMQIYETLREMPELGDE